MTDDEVPGDGDRDGLAHRTSISTGLTLLF
jgi:hypothetical protein